MTLYRKVALATLAFTLFVILWGAYVRISGSGAGCGSHWPTCNGDVIPRSPGQKTVVEFTHRVTSFASLVLVVWQLVLALRTFPAGHAARRAAAASLFFMLTEALVGAGLVLFEMVAQNKSVARGYWVGVHLTNTFLLVASIALANWAGLERADEPPPTTELAGVDGLGRDRLRVLFAAAATAVLVVGVTGAIAALGDTLFPAKSLAEGLSEDVSKHAHVFVQLRGLHPFAAAITAVVVLTIAGAFARSALPSVRRMATWLGIAVVVQMAVGIANLLSLAPASLQLLHLLAADGVWIALCLLAATALTHARSVEPSVMKPAATP
jgi:heme A synthase